MPSRYDARYTPAQILLPPFTPVVRNLIIANVAIQLMQFIAGPEATFKIQELFALDPGRVVGSFWIWQPLTYMFLHHPADIMHIVFNMLYLWFFGGEISQRWGGARFLKFYLICGAGAGVITVLVNALRRDDSATIGASGAVFGLLMAFGMLYPHRTVIFIIFPIPARVLVAIMAAVQLWNIGAFTRSGISYLAHLGGMAVAWLYLTGWWDPRRLWAEARWWLRRRRFTELRRDRDADDVDRFRFH